MPKFKQGKNVIDLKEPTVDFFKHMLDNLSFGGIFIDMNRKIKYCNNNVGRIFDYPVSEILGKPTDVLYGDRRSKKTDPREIYNALEKNGFHVGTAKGITKTGREIDIQLSTFLVKPNEGAIIFVEKIERPTHLVIQKENLVQNLLDTIPDMIYFKDLGNRFILVNKAHADALNLSPAEVVGKSDLDFFPKEIAEKYFEDDNNVVRTGKPVVGKIESAPRPDGGITYVSTTKMPHYDEFGNIIGTIGITRNITDKMIAEEELRVYKTHLEDIVRERTKDLEDTNSKLLRMYNVKSELTSMVSHELRTPLTILKESITLIQDGTLGAVNEKQSNSLNLAIKNIFRLERLINNVLDFSKLENKKMKFKIVNGNVNELIRQVLKGYDVVPRKGGLEIVSALDSTLPLTKLDTDCVIQVLHNLVSNAIKFTEKGQIKVESKHDDKEITVSVTDTGRGIKKEDLPRMFERFEQINSEENSASGIHGTGLGLAISKQIIEQFGGRISVKSEYGKGSTFTFSLPIRA